MVKLYLQELEIQKSQVLLLFLKLVKIKPEIV